MSSAATGATVVLRGVTVEAGRTRALDRVDLRISAGERVAVVGPSGAGKTTLLMVVNGTVVPQHGTVEVLGARPGVAGPAARRARSRVGTVYQHLHLAGPLAVIHNVNAGRLPRWSSPRALWSLVRPQEVEDVERLLARVGIADKVWARADALSGGEQQRVAIARVLAQQPEVILADEPVASLDPARAREVVNLLCDVAAEEGRSLLVSLHAFDLARRSCDRIVGLRSGRVVFDAAASAVTDAMAADLYRIEQGR